MKKRSVLFVMIIVCLFFLNFKLIQAQQAKENTDQEKAYLLGKFDPSKKINFIKISSKYKVNGGNLYLRKEAYNAFSDMRKSALKDKITLNIVSATRNFDTQKTIWNNKWTGVTIVAGKNLKKSYPDELERFKKILEYSAVPGTSRHHFGTDIDINSVDPSYFNTTKGKKVYNWLNKNASKFGFCQPYNSGRKTGYNEEKWHFTYLPISKDLTSEYQKLITDKDISGFFGDKYVPQMNLINNYVLAINPACL